MADTRFELIPGNRLKVQDAVTGVSLENVPPHERDELILRLRVGPAKTIIGVQAEVLDAEERVVLRLAPFSVLAISRIAWSQNNAARLTDIVAEGVRAIAPSFFAWPCTVLIPEAP